MGPAAIIKLRQDEMGLAEAAAYLGMMPNTLRNKLTMGSGPECSKVFGRLRFRKIDLDAYIKQNTERRRAYS